MPNDILVINELFPKDTLTFQGEGKNIGMPCVFIRLGGCNLHCSFCDTSYTWRWTDKHPHVSGKVYNPKKELHPMKVSEVTEWVLGHPARPQAVVISGGEPMLQQKALERLTKILHFNNIWTEMETAGTVKPFNWALVRQFTVSPKLANSGNSLKERYKPDVLDWFSDSQRAIFKFVVTQESDFDEIDELVKRHRMHDVYIMPEGIDSETIKTRLQKIAMMALERKYRLTTRLHVELFGNKRGI